MAKRSLTEVSPSNEEGMNNYISKRAVPSPYEILPGVYSQMAVAQELNYKLHEELQAELPPSKVTGALLTYPGIPDEWGKLLNIMGVAHDPEGVPPYSTKGYHQALARASGSVGNSIEGKLDADGRRRAQWLAKLMVGRSRLTPLHIKKMVLTGVPEMTASIEKKYEIVKKWHDHYTDYARLIKSGDMSRLAEQFDVYFCFFTGRRYQPDRVGKKRVVLDWEGKWVTANKALPDIVDPSPYREHFTCCRSRKINASPLGATYPLRALAKEIEGHFDQNYGFTFYHTGADSLAAKTQLYTALYMLDVDNHDVNMPPELRDILCDAVGVVFGQFYAQLLRMTFRMPQLIKNDYRGGKGIKLQGDPMRPASYTADYVNPSGHPLTSILAKLAGVFYPYDALVRAGRVPDTEEALIQLLRGELEIAFLNAGDNLAMLGHDGGKEELDKHSPYCNYSETTTFQGMVAIESPSGGISWTPNITSYALNFFCPGRPIGHPQRGHWANGWIERKAVYSAAPSFEKARDAVNRVTKDVLGTTIDDYAELRKSGAVYIGRSAVDAEFILNPDIIHYKRHAEEISDEVLEQVFFTVEPRQYQEMHEYLITA